MDGFLTTPLVEAQAGVISKAQLAGLGVTEGAVEAALRRGQLLRLHRGVYAVGHRVLTPRGRWWAAVLAGGAGTVLSHRSASTLRDFWATSRSAVDITTPRRIRQPGITAHRSRLHPDDATTHEGLPTTTPERTLVDLADVLTLRQLEQAYDRARINRLLSLDALDAALHRARGRRGAPALCRIVDQDRPAQLTSNPFERAFLDLIRRHGLPEPKVNGYLLGVQVDFHWPEQRLIVETDGGHHLLPRHVARDKRRDARLLAAGWRTLRFSHHDVTKDPAFVLGVLRPLLT